MDVSCPAAHIKATEVGLSETGAPPQGLAVELWEGGELALFSWDTVAARPAVPITPAEAGVLALIVRGCSNAEIAAERGVSMRTVANQVASLLKKLRAGSRFELIRQYGGNRARR
jgi:DNA-binding NarL/FixJ family response regulator